jgi:hypothetical protein
MHLVSQNQPLVALALDQVVDKMAALIFGETAHRAGVAMHDFRDGRVGLRE